MSELSPQLKRLIRCARLESPPPVPPVPLGFALRVARSGLTAPAPDPLELWQSVLRKSSWAAAAVLLLGLGFLSAQWLHQNSAYDLSTAYDVVSMEVVP